MMKILVTGGAGYIGAVLVPMLLAQDHQVTVIDNLMYRQHALLDCCADKNLTMIRGDARDPSLIKTALKEADAIFPLACLTGAPLCAKDPEAAQSTIIDAIKLILEMRSHSQILVYPTTNSGYGVGETGKHCTEETPLRPVSLYGQLKTQAEKMILDQGQAITLRLATAFGASPRMRLDLLVNDFTYRAVYDRFVVLFEAHFKRNYIHVRDVANAFIFCLKHFDQMKNTPYNVGLSNANLTKFELCQEIQKQVREFYFVESAVGEDPDKRDYLVSNEKIEACGFKPQFSLSQGIAELVKAYKIIKRTEYANV